MLSDKRLLARDAEDGSEIVVRVQPDTENIMRRKSPLNAGSGRSAQSRGTSSVM